MSFGADSTILPAERTWRLNGTVLDLSFETPACFLLELDHEINRCKLLDNIE